MNNNTNSDIQTWLSQTREAGLSDEKIKESLINNGWDEVQIAELISIQSPPSNVEPSTSSSEIQNSSQEQIGTGGKLPGVFELIKQAFGILKSSISNFIIITIITMILAGIIGLVFVVIGFGAVLTIFSTDISSGIVQWILGFLLMAGIAIVISFVFSWVQASLMIAIAVKDAKIGSILSRALKLMISYWWLSLLQSFFIIGGMMLFAIPGIIFSIWFSFAVFVLIVENQKGLQALLKSKEYVRDYWWAVLGRNLAVLAVFYLPIVIISFILSNTNAAPVVEVIDLLFLFTVLPFLMSYSYVIYNSLRKIKGSKIDVPQKKAGLIITAIAGLLIIPIIILAIGGLALSGASDKAADANRKSDISQLRIAVVLYHDDEGQYPEYLNVLIPLYTPIALTDPKSNESYEYTTTDNGTNFLICADLEEEDISGNTEYCVNLQGNTSNNDTLDNFQLNLLQ